MENQERSIELPKDDLSGDIAEIADGLSAHVAGVAKDALKRLKAIADKATEKRNEELGIKIDNLNSQLTGYRRENDFLRQQLIAILQSHNQSAESQARDDVVNKNLPQPQPVPYSEYERLAQKLNILQQQLLQSNEQHKTEATARRMLIDKMRAAKQTAREWMDYHRRWQEKTRMSLSKRQDRISSFDTPGSIGNGHRSPISPLVEPGPPSPGFGRLNDIIHSTDRLLVPDESAISESSVARQHVLNRFVPSGKETGQRSRHDANQRPHNSAAGSAQNSTSQDDTMPVTQGTERESERRAGKEILGQITSASDDDLPVLVEERGLKRRRVDSNPNKHVIPNGRAEHAIIKEEPLGDDVIVTSTSRLTDTIDLDEVGGKIDTPRKRQRRQQMLQLAAGTPSTCNPILKHMRSLSEPPFHKSDIVPPEETPQAKIPLLETFVMATPANGRSGYISGNDRPRSEPLNIPKGHGARLPSAGSPLSGQSTVLSPIDVNTRLLPTTSAVGKPRSNRRKNHSRGAEAIHLLSEDGTGEDEEHTGPTPAPSLRATQNRKISVDRLTTLLEGGSHVAMIPLPGPIPSPGSKALLTQATKVYPSGTSKKIPAVFKVPELPKATQRDLPKSSASKAKPRSAHQKEPTSRPIPCRDRSPSALRPSDFKLNPNINHGLDYAFVEPIRGRAARRCLPGCTDPSCCGDAIRALAADLRPSIPRPIFPDSPEDLNLSDEDYLIKKHMGERWNREYVANLSPEKREHLLLEARTKIIAQRHGRHKFTSGRRKTPPGYWNADMQSTPELEEDRRRGEQIEREMVTERYHEAMRGGRWQFRDE